MTHEPMNQHKAMAMTGKPEQCAPAKQTEAIKTKAVPKKGK